MVPLARGRASYAHNLPAPEDCDARLVASGEMRVPGGGREVPRTLRSRGVLCFFILFSFIFLGDVAESLTTENDGRLLAEEVPRPQLGEGPGEGAPPEVLQRRDLLASAPPPPPAGERPTEPTHPTLLLGFEIFQRFDRCDWNCTSPLSSPPHPPTPRRTQQTESSRTGRYRAAARVTTARAAWRPWATEAWLSAGASARRPPSGGSRTREQTRGRTPCYGGGAGLHSC